MAINIFQLAQNTLPFQITENSYSQLCIDFQPVITLKIKDLFYSYLQVMKFVKQEKFFQEMTERLDQAVKVYLSNQVEYDKNNMELCAVDSVHKIHPQYYSKGLATYEWLISACLSQNNFVQKLDFKQLDFSTCYQQYVEYLYMRKLYRKENQILVPSLNADVMWHSHMQNPQKYTSNMECTLGVVLYHTDDFLPNDRAKYALQTQDIRTSLVKSKIDHFLFQACSITM